MVALKPFISPLREPLTSSTRRSETRKLLQGLANGGNSFKAAVFFGPGWKGAPAGSLETVPMCLHELGHWQGSESITEVMDSATSSVSVCCSGGAGAGVSPRPGAAAPGAGSVAAGAICHVGSWQA